MLALALLAGVAAKVLILVDLLPFVDAFRGRPLIYNTLWKTIIYAIASVLYRLLETLVHLLRQERNIDRALRQLLADQNWPRFWGIQLWLTALLLLFVAARELVRAVGGGEVVRRMFFRRSAA